MKKLLSILFCLIWAFSVNSEEPETEGLKYLTPTPSGDVHFAEPFDAEDAMDSWTLSKADKEGVESEISKYDGKWSVEQAAAGALDGDTGLVLKDAAKHHAISTSLDRPFVFGEEPFVLQYEVNFQDGIGCGGAYVKLLAQSDELKLSEFHDKTQYTIMFGPDKCGEDYKLHFIFQHKNPLTGAYEEKHAPKTSGLSTYYNDKKPHLYTLVVNPDNTFKIYIDKKEVNSGSLLTDMTPPVNPPKEIEDVSDIKPEEWDERETIPDPSASKPEDWDEDAPAEIADPSAEMPDGWLENEPLLIADPEATQPEDWEDDIDGEWEAPQVDNPICVEAPGCGVWEPPSISNPAFKGKWRASHIPNPAYKGIWKPRVIPNPDFFEDTQPFQMTTIGALGFELWSMSNEIMFDNIIITTDKSVADDYASNTFALKKEILASKEPGMFENLVSAAQERPWLWIVYVLVIGLPAILFFVMCCRKSKVTSDADAKKTDAVSPDDPHPETEGEEEAATPSEATEDPKSLAGDSQDEGADGDGKVEDKEVTRGDLEEAEDSQEEGMGDNSNNDSEVEIESGDGSVKKSPRKRKPRVQD